MVKKGMSLKEIYESGKFPKPTYRAIDVQIKRLGSYVTQISKAEIPDFDDVLARYGCMEIPRTFP